MATVKTLGNMKARIADELVRSDLASQIALAIDDAITEAASNRFWFNEVRGLTLPLVSAQEYYTSDDYADLTAIDAVYFYVGGTRRPIYVTDNSDMDRLAEGAFVGGEPYRFSRYGPSLRIYPVPNVDTYTIYIDGVSRLPQLTLDADTNAWMNEGERLVRAIAKRNLFLDVMRDIDQDEIDRQQALVTNFTRELMGKSYDRSATGQMAYND